MAAIQLTQTLEHYSKGVKAWFQDDDAGWISVTVVSNDIIQGKEVKIVFRDDADADKELIFHETLSNLEKNNGASLPPLRNPPKLEMTDDLTNLSYLNEPSVLNTIRARYQERTIYTYSGIVLIATNPFDRIPLYDQDVIQKYSGRRRGDLEPHLFAIAEDAYRCMVREGSNQTIVVSGESGAGKTVSAKYIMRYFATADDPETAGRIGKGGSGAMTKVEEQILATNPIMEAFGNAKTTRNDNSSRFGKYTEIQFDKRCNIVGAKIRTYLLERSRLIFQPETERNYHIFYQLCAGAPEKEREQLGLASWDNFHYLKQGGTGDIMGVNDADDFELTLRSLSLIGISVQTQWKIFHLLAALLHVGNIDIGGRTDATMSDEDSCLKKATDLLGIHAADTRKWLTRKQIATRSEKIVTNLSPTQAQTVRDSMAKYIYSSLFDWLVSVINETLSCSEEASVSTFIGVLDIYGFEHFKKNSFEQFCINYANEKLQQQFNQHVFKLEQEEYAREEIDWTFISFSDNQKCIDLIEAKMGILSLLDEESRLPSGSDEGFCTKLYQQFSTANYQDHFKKPRFSNNAFTVIHYARDVQYESEGFLEKNKDTVPEELLALIHSSSSDFLVEVIQASNNMSGSTTPPENPKRQNGGLKKPTLGSIFKQSLISLMDTITHTNVHYIRCIKPNESKMAWVFEPNMVLAQLRACGVLETIRISCAGYPTRWTYEEFADRYYALVHSQHWDPRLKPDIRKLCGVILDACVKDPDRYQLGRTKIFFRAGQLAYLEKLRTDQWNKYVVLIQKNARRFIVRIRYQRILTTIRHLQQVARARQARRDLEERRREHAAILIQSYWRRYLARKDFLAQRAFLVALQAAVRARIAQRRIGQVRREKAATQIQKMVRGFFARRYVREQRSHIIRIQTCVRRREARKQLVLLKAEARSVSHFKEVSYKLESKVVELTQNLAQQKEEKASLKSKANHLESQIRSWIEKYDRLDKKARDLEGVIGKPDLASTNGSAADSVPSALHDEYKTSLHKIKHQDKEIARLTEELTIQKEEINKLRLASQTAYKNVDHADVSELKHQITALKAQLSLTLALPKRSLSNARKTPSGRSRLNQTPLYGPKQSSNLVRIVPDDHDTVKMLRVADAQPEQVAQVVIDYKTAILTQLVVSAGAMARQPQSQPIDPQGLFYPARLAYTISSALSRQGRLDASRDWLLAWMDAVETQCEDLRHEDDSTTEVYAYWLTNVHQLLSWVVSDKKKVREGGDTKDAYNTLIFELERLEDIVYHYWLDALRNELKPMALQALIESQALPGFIVSDSSRSYAKLSGTSQTLYTMDALLDKLSTVETMTTHMELDPSVSRHMLIALVKCINVDTFNDLVMRRNFNSWKRAMQIQYNITRLDDWCKAHLVPEAMTELEHLIQAVKLLQLKKTTMDDIKIIEDVCWLLKPTQTHKLVQNYAVADYEPPIGHEILRAVGARVNSTKDDHLLLSLPGRDDFVYEVPVLAERPVPSSNDKPIIPDEAKLPHQEYLLAMLDV